MFDYTNLRRYILYKFGKIENFAEALGVSRQAVSVKLNGKSGFTQDKIIEWADVLEIPAEEVGKYFFVVKFNKQNK